MKDHRNGELPSVEQTAVEELARRVVLRVAPEEEEIFDAVREAYRRDPQRLGGRGGGRDPMLGFGVEAAAALLTPLALGIGVEVVRHLTLEAVGAIEVGERLRRLLGRRRGTGSADGQASPPPAAENDEADPPADAPAVDRARIREIVLVRCRQAGVDDDRAGLIADAVVGALHNGG